MAATFIIDTPAVFALGVLVSLFALPEPEERRRSFVEVWPFVPGLATTAVFFGTAVASYRVAPDWMWMYFVPEPRMTRLGTLYVGILLYLLPYALAFALGLELRRRARSLPALAIGIALAAQVLVVGGLWSRYHLIGTLDQWKTGKAVPLPSQVEVGRVSAIGGSLIALFLASIVVGYVPRRRQWLRSIPRFLNGAEEAIVAAMGHRMFPRDPDPRALSRELSCYIGSMTFPNRAGVRLLIFAVQWLVPFVSHLPSRFTSLTDEQKDGYLGQLSHHPSDVLRMVLIVPKTLLSVLYYDRPEVLRSIGAEYFCRQEERPAAFPETPRARTEPA